ncbi:MAG: 50S ribosomal protein L4 [Deferribacteraceae bacterium]|jgi:large subunit ribosomal protein L4|nr:50S ribosomal protein L4 [Deferribacteraceae bacterium]
MAQVEIRNQLNEVVGSAQISDEIVGAKINPVLIHEVVTMQLASRRAGTHKTKTRGNVSGGGRKPWKQKGTGHARSGSIRSPIWKGGGVIFGPLPRDYSYTMPKKKVKAALKSIISSKFSENRIIFIDEFKIESGKTRDAAKVLANFADGDERSLRRGWFPSGVEGLRRALIITDNFDDPAYLSMRNLPQVNFLHLDGLNVYDLAKAGKIFISARFIPLLEERFAAVKSEGEEA